MSPITTHVLDTARGRPASGVLVVLERLVPAGRSSIPPGPSGGSAARPSTPPTAGAEWETLGRGETDQDGRLRTLLPADHALSAGVYRLTFDSRAYFRALGIQSFYPIVPIVFEVRAPAEHYHVPLLLSPFGYSTYRGS